MASPEKVETLSQCKNRHKNELRALKKDWDQKVKNARRQEKKDLKKQRIVAQQKLKDAQAEHLKNLNNESSCEKKNETEEVPLENTMMIDQKPKRKTKAMKRREKKEAKEEEELRRIEEEKANQIDYKGIEIRKIQAKAGMGYIIRDIKSDGHCLYRAIATQLELLGHEQQYDFVGLRKVCREYIETNPEDFRAFIENGEEGFKQYLDNLVNMNEVFWGGEPELVALSRALQRRIIVYKAEEEPLEFCLEDVVDEKPLKISYHLYYLALGEHYNSVERIF